MNFFQKVGQAIVGFFHSDTAKKILALGKLILEQVLGNMASSLSTITQEEVAKAEASGKADKYTVAFAAIRSRLPQIGESAINLAIEIAVSALKSK